MKTDLNAIDRENFMVHEHIVNGEILTLIQPIHIGVKWSQENKIFRSSVWNGKGELVSAGFPKFVNYGENPAVFPPPTDLKGCTIVEKIDGSLLIVSKYKGNYILRTRGTVDATKLDNGVELELFKQNFLPKLDKLMKGQDTWNESILFEWVSPLQKIILSYGDQPDWYLVGMVNNEDYSLVSQGSLDDVALYWGWKRPVTYMFSTIEDLMANIEAWKGKEGVVVYSGNGQMLHKVKSAWYLCCHRMKSELSSIEKVLDVFFAIGKPSYQDFCKYLETTFDYELMIQCIPYISRICQASKEVSEIIDGMNSFIEIQLKPLPTRKLQAVVTLQSYGKTNRANFVFSLLDGKSLTDDQIKKLYYQVMKK